MTEDNNTVDAGQPEGTFDPDKTPGFTSALEGLSMDNGITFGEDLESGSLFPTIIKDQDASEDTPEQIAAPEDGPAAAPELAPLVPVVTPETAPPEDREVLDQRLRDQQSFFSRRENQLVEMADEARSENADLRERLARMEGRLGLDGEDEVTDPDYEDTPNPAQELTGPQLRELIDAELGKGTADRLQIANEDEVMRETFLQEIVNICDNGEGVIMDHQEELLRVMDYLETSTGEDVSITSAWSAMKGGLRMPSDPAPASETQNFAPSEGGMTDTSDTAKQAQAARAKAALLSQPPEVSGEDGLDPSPSPGTSNVLSIREAGRAALEELEIRNFSDLGLS